jgi:hypothetical protein
VSPSDPRNPDDPDAGRPTGGEASGGDADGAEGEAAVWAALRELGSLDLEAVQVRSRPAGERPALIEVETEGAEAGGSRVTVELRHRGQRVTRVEEAAPSPRGEQRAAALATVAAVRALLPPGVADVHLDWFDILPPPTPHRPSVVHCSVALRTAAGEDVLVGSSIIRDDGPAAAARAVLDAINRRFGDLAGA